MTRLGAVTPITPTIGAEISGVDLRSTSAELIHQIRQDLLEYRAIFFRDQQLSVEEHKAFARAFGTLHVNAILASTSAAKDPEISDILLDETTKTSYTEEFHADRSYDLEPPFGSILYMHETPKGGGGDTVFVNTIAAYEALSSSMKQYLQGTTAIHDGHEQLRAGAGINTSAAIAEHPIVRTHPETGQKGLFVNRMYTTHIVGVSPMESRAILGFLYQHQEALQFQCRFKWTPRTVAFWDNRCTLHSAIWDYYPERRFGQRVTIRGDRPF
jgi:taurine dioxygenase